MKRSLGAFWFLYFAAGGLIFPFYGLYLSAEAGLSATEVGIVVTMTPLVGLVAPTVWGRFADRSARRSRILATAVSGVAVMTMLLSLLSGAYALALGTAALAAFSTGVLPLGVSASLAALGERAGEVYGRVRVWGTIGFLIFVTGFPLALARLGGGLVWMFAVAAFVTAAAAAVALTIPERPAAVARDVGGDWHELTTNRPFLRALVFAALASLFMQGPMNLFPLYVRARGGGLEALSDMWVLMLLPEIPLMAFSGHALRRIGPRGLLAGAAAAGAIRWLVTGWSTDSSVVYAAQALHGVLVAGISIGGPLYVEGVVPERLRATGQALYATAAVGVGGVLSNVIAGWLIDRFGADSPFVIGGAGCLALALAVPVLLPPPARRAARPLGRL